MNRSFSKIMVPVDLTINTEVAVKRALELADMSCNLHLLYVEGKSFSVKSALANVLKARQKEQLPLEDLEKKLQQWKDAILNYNSSLKVYTWKIIDSDIQHAIQKKALELNADLIIIGKNCNHALLPFLNTVTPSFIAHATGIPVLTSKPGAIHSRIKTILVPLSSSYFFDKGSLLTLIAQKCQLSVHLVYFSDHHDDQSGFPEHLVQMYQWLRSHVKCAVKITVLAGKNKPKRLLNFAREIDADFMLLASGNETKGGWLNNHISDLILPSSKLQVLTVRSN